MGHSFLAIRPHGVDARVQRLAQHALHELKAKEMPEGRDHMLHGCARTAARHLTNKPISVSKLHCAFGRLCPVDAQQLEKPSKISAMPADRALRQTTILAQVPHETGALLI